MIKAADVLRADILAMTAYPVAAEVAGFIKLDAMENPYRLPEKLRIELARRLAEAPINRYPIPSHKRLKAAIGAKFGVPDTLGLMLGNGSDELISLLASAVAKPGAVILAPVPGFVMYELSAKLANVKFVGVPLNEDFSINLQRMRDAYTEHRPALTYLAFPNNPTGNCFDAQAFEALIAEAPGLVVSDEAYQPFARDSWIGKVSQYDHLLIMRTVSKLGLAGLRLGYLAGAKHWIEQLEKIRPPYNINVLSAIAAEFALEHAAELEGQAARIVVDRDRLATALAGLPGVEVFPSRANFILIRLANSRLVHAHLVSRKVLVREVSTMHPLLTSCLRITVGTAVENKVLLEMLGEAIAQAQADAELNPQSHA